MQVLAPSQVPDGNSEESGLLPISESCQQELGPLIGARSAMVSHEFPALPSMRLGPHPEAFLGMLRDSDGFRPSRGRALAATTLTASTGLQPTGRALPPLLPRSLTPDEHWRQACFATEHPLAQLPPLPAQLLQAARRLQDMGPAVNDWRKMQFARIRQLANDLAGLQEKWCESLHPQVRRIIGKWHLPLMHVLAKEAGSEDMFFCLDFTAGLTCAGRAAHSFVLPLKITKPALSVQELLRNAPARNAELLAAVRSSGDIDLDRASLLKTQQEIDAGLMLRPWDASALPSWVTVVSRRFPIWEHHGAQAQRKCRNIDEMSESGLNSTVEDFETYIPRGIEHILALVRSLQQLFSSQTQLLGYTADFKAAYRQIAVAPDQFKLQGIAWWDCKQNKVMVGVLTALAFGSRRAPANWGRLVTLLVTIAWHHLSLLVLDYVDDINAIEPAFCAEGSRQAWMELMEILGLQLDPKKCSPVASHQFEALGVRWVLNDPSGVVEVTEARVASLRADIQAILEANMLYPGQAARLRGRLGFAVVASFGRFGRAQLSALKRRQYASGLKDFKLTPVLTAQLRWWFTRLSCLPPRSIPRSPQRRFLVAYSDGEGSGRVAVSLTFLDRQTQFCGALVPQELLQRWGCKQNIHRIEAVGPSILFLTWPLQLQGQLLLFFIDNQSALGSMIGGWSNESVLNDITALTWALAADLHCFVFF